MSHALSASSSTPSTSSAGRTPVVPHRRSPLQWICVIACIVFAGFLMMFSFDTPVFTVGFVMHNVPTMIVLLGAVLAWWRAWAGAAWMFAACIAGLAFYQGFAGRWDWMVAIIGPPLLIALLLAFDAVRTR